MEPIHKFNNGRGATLCHKCRAIITNGLTEDLYCKTCNPMEQTIVYIINEWHHAHSVDVVTATYTAQDEEFVHGEYESFQEYVDEMIMDEIEEQKQQYVNCIALTPEAFNDLKTKQI